MYDVGGIPGLLGAIVIAATESYTFLFRTQSCPPDFCNVCDRTCTSDDQCRICRTPFSPSYFVTIRLCPVSSRNRATNVAASVRSYRSICLTSAARSNTVFSGEDFLEYSHSIASTIACQRGTRSCIPRSLKQNI